MKITLERLREIITEEVIKEELAPEIAVPAIAAMLQGTDSVDTSEIFGAVFDQMYGEGALEGEAERMASAEEPEEEDFPTEYQPGGSEGDRPVMGFEENINEIIQEEYYIYMIEQEYKLLQEAPNAEGILRSSYGLSPGEISPIDLKSGWEEVLADRYAPPAERAGAEMSKELYDKLEDLAVQSAVDISNADIYWQKYLNLGGSLRDIIAAAPESADIVGTLEKLHQRLRNRQEHEGAEDDPESMRDFQGRPISRWSKSQDDTSALQEEEKYKKSFYRAKEKRADDLINKGVNKDMAYGIADKQVAKAGKKKKKGK